MYKIKSYGYADDDLPFSICVQDDKLTAIGICERRRKHDLVIHQSQLERL